MTRLSPAFLCVVGLLIAVLTACKARAEMTFGCQFVWNNASKDNSISDCFKHPQLSKQWSYFILPAIACIVCATALVVFPVILCCRSCCCSVRNARPKTKEGRERAGCWLYMWICIAVLFGIAVCLFIIVGSYMIKKSSQNIVDGIQDYTINKFNSSLNEIKQWNNNTADVIDTTVLSDFVTKMEQIKDDADKYFDVYLTWVEIIVDIAGCMGILMMMLVLAVACCKCTGIGLGVFTIVYVVFSVLYALLAVGFTIFMYFVIAGCGEITQQYHRAPGIGQWYYVPWYRYNYNFDALLDNLTTYSSAMHTTACTDILKICDTAKDVVTDNSKLFYCTFATQEECLTAANDGNIFENNLFLKPGLDNLLVTNTTGWSFMPNVTVSECAERCSDIGDLKAKTVSQSLKIINDEEAAFDSIHHIITQMQDENLFLDTLLWSTQTKYSLIDKWKESGEQNICANMTTASILLGVGFLVGAVMFLIGFYVLQRGSFIWIRKTEYDAPSLSSDFD